MTFVGGSIADSDGSGVEESVARSIIKYDEEYEFFQECRLDCVFIINILVYCHIYIYVYIYMYIVY